jgi:hypothetical protein
MGALLVLVGQHSAFTAYYVYRDNTLLETVSNFRRKNRKAGCHHKFVSSFSYFCVPLLVIYRYHY